jgi:hypothetical protein
MLSGGDLNTGESQGVCSECQRHSSSMSLQPRMAVRLLLSNAAICTLQSGLRLGLMLVFIRAMVSGNAVSWRWPWKVWLN